MKGLNSLSVSGLLHSARAPKCDSLVDIEAENIFVNFRQTRRFRLGGVEERNEHVGNIYSAATSNSTSLTSSAKIFRGTFFFVFYGLCSIQKVTKLKS